jgi:glutathione S-transferase
MKMPTIYGDPLSPHIRALVFAFAEKDVVCSVEPPHLGASLAEVFPLEIEQRRPVKEPRLLWNSHHIRGGEACLRFVEEHFESVPLVPSDGEARTRMDQALKLYYDEAVHTLGWEVAAPYVLALATSTMLDSMPADSVERARATVAKLEYLLGQEDFFGGNTLSLADVAISGLFEHLAAFREYALLVADGSTLRAWYKRISRRSAFDLTKQTGGQIPGLFYAA